MSHDDALRKILIDDTQAAREKEERQFRIKARVEPLTRIAAIGLIAAIAFTSRWMNFTEFSYLSLAWATALALIFHGGLTWWILHRFLRRAPWVYDVINWMDFGLMTVGVYFTGGESSVLSFVYLVRIADQISASPRRIVYFTLLYFIFYGAMLVYISTVDNRAIDLRLEGFKVLGMTLCAVYLYVIGLNVHNLKGRLAFFVREAKQSFRLSERQRTELVQINRLVAVINEKTDFDQFLMEVIKHVSAVLPVDQAGVLVREKSSDTFKIEISHGPLNWHTISEFPFDSILTLQGVGQSLTEEVVRCKNEDGSGERLVMAVSVNGVPHGFFIFETTRDHSSFPEDARSYLMDLLPHIKSAFIKTRLLDELKQLNELKNEFLGIAAHDLRSPLSAIIGYLENMLFDIKDGRFDVDQGGRDMEDIVRVARKMIHLITNLLDLSAIESGKIALDLHRVNLKEILEDSRKLHNRIADQKDIRLIMETEKDLPAVIADSLRLSEVVDNLLSNALKYTYAGGEVRVFCEVHTDEVVTNIVDTGQGIAEEDMDKLFKGFVKLKGKPTGGEFSTGLGLAIVKKIIDLHGGKVWVQSKKGQGSVFSFSLPVAPHS